MMEGALQGPQLAWTIGHEPPSSTYDEFLYITSNRFFVANSKSCFRLIAIKGSVMTNSRVRTVANYLRENTVEILGLTYNRSLHLPPAILRRSLQFAEFNGHSKIRPIQRTALRASLGKGLPSKARIVCRSIPFPAHLRLFPPGRAKLTTSPVPTGSPAPMMMRGWSWLLA